MQTTLDKQGAGALWGSFIGDALAMPVHWYYDRAALRRDYGVVRDYLRPRNSHPDSILWRSTYTPLNERGDILHDQAPYGGQRGIHYHQFLRAGENTLNLQLGRVLIESLVACGRYDADDYLQRYLDFMLTPGRHRDTYVEECHRKFFTAYARGVVPRKCGANDIHIGGLAHVGVLCAFGGSSLSRPAMPSDHEPMGVSLSRPSASARGATADPSGTLSRPTGEGWGAGGFMGTERDATQEAVREHVQLTHRAPEVLKAADALVRILVGVLAGGGLREAIFQHGSDWLSERTARQWSREPDEVVVGQRISPACYIAEAFPASLYLAWKYADDLEAGLIANTNLGGDNSHRGAVVGALLGAATGAERIPVRWREELCHAPTLRRHIGP